MLKIWVTMVTKQRYFMNIVNLEALSERISRGDINEVLDEFNRKAFIVCNKISEFHIVE
jgi:hypothetical protein